MADGAGIFGEAGDCLRIVATGRGTIRTQHVHTTRTHNTDTQHVYTRTVYNILQTEQQGYAGRTDE